MENEERERDKRDKRDKRKINLKSHITHAHVYIHSIVIRILASRVSFSSLSTKLLNYHEHLVG